MFTPPNPISHVSSAAFAQARLRPGSALAQVAQVLQCSTPYHISPLRNYPTIKEFLSRFRMDELAPRPNLLPHSLYSPFGCLVQITLKESRQGFISLNVVYFRGFLLRLALSRLLDPAKPAQGLRAHRPPVSNVEGCSETFSRLFCSYLGSGGSYRLAELLGTSLRRLVACAGCFV
jgi:hypothetical protein